MRSTYVSPTRRSMTLNRFSPRRHGLISPRFIILMIGSVVLILLLYLMPRSSNRNALLTAQQMRGTPLGYCQASLHGDEGNLKGRKLKMIQMVIRHGDRSPIHSLTSERPYFSCKFSDPELVKLVQRFHRYKIIGKEGKASMDVLGPETLGGHKGKDECFPGQLTERGFKQQIATGRYLRLRYPTLTLESSDEVYFRSTNYPRTFQSGASLLLGLAPELEEIVAHVIETSSHETLFGVGLQGASRRRSMDPVESEERGYCQHAVELAAQQERAFVPDKALDAELEQLGADMDLSVADQTDPVMAAACHDKPLPCVTSTATGASKCMSRQTLKALKEQTDRLYCERYLGQQGGREGTRLAMYPFLKEVAERFKQQSKVKLTVYSGHDTVIGPSLGGLSAFDCKWPPYASRVIFELWGGIDEEGEDMLRIVYNGRAIPDLRNIYCSSLSSSSDTNKRSSADSSLIPLNCFEAYVDSLIGPESTLEKVCLSSK